ncbi:unnamed protein product [Rotaria socialis]|uniref:F5/8 type C domain-containing protein n=1 Tax=Rotaria socialis TaxID=392032 RepID=A0A820UX09_9BILA|nr:unnamed protein product [Rotaria socialis]
MIFMIYFIATIKSIETSTQVCNGPLGMISGEIRDWQITASSTLWDTDCHEKHARLYQSGDRAWCARHKSDSEWLQIDLGIAAKISGVLTQGRANKEEYVMSFMVSYSTDAFRWQYLVDRYGNQKVGYFNVKINNSFEMIERLNNIRKLLDYNRIEYNIHLMELNIISSIEVYDC